MLTHIIEQVSKVHFKFNLPKCGYFVTNEKDRVNLQIYGVDVPAISAEGTYKYLGVAFSCPKRQNLDSIITNALDDFNHIVASELHPSQKLHAYRTFIHSRFPFHLRNRHINVLTLSSKQKRQPSGYTPDFGFDNKIKKIIKSIADTSRFQAFNNDFM